MRYTVYWTGNSIMLMKHRIRVCMKQSTGNTANTGTTANINIHTILPVSCVNGPGMRTVIWVKGCIFHCKGCFNPDLLSFAPHKLMKIEDIVSEIPSHEVEGVTISGGEPFCQAMELRILAHAIKDSDLSLMVYTGYEYNYLVESGNIYMKEFLEYIDILVDGPYDENCEPNTLWAGSGNQNIIFLTDRYAHYGGNISHSHRYSEYHIGNDGLVKTTGFFNL